MPQLQLDQSQIERARESARRIARRVFDDMSVFTTTTVERATLRLLGIDGVDENFVPLPNRVNSQGKMRQPTAATAAFRSSAWTGTPSS